MEPIISPILIYLIDISPNIQCLCNLLACVTISFTVVVTTIWLITKLSVFDEDDKQYTARLCLKIIKYSLIFAVILVVIASLIPSK